MQKSLIKFFILIFIGLKSQQQYIQNDEQYKSAKYYPYNQSEIINIYENNYEKLLPLYILDLKSDNSNKIQIMVSQGGDVNYNQTQDELHTIQGGPDMRVSFLQQNNYIVQCAEKWMFNNYCGTYLEIHKPLNTTIIYFQRIKQIIATDDYIDEYFLTKQLCAGRYEIWWVIKARVGNIIQKIKQFYVQLPSC